LCVAKCLPESEGPRHVRDRQVDRNFRVHCSVFLLGRVDHFGGSAVFLTDQNYDEQIH
jgi:hypothetical protein